MRRRNYPAGMFCIVAGLFMWGFSTAPVADRLIGPLEAAYDIPRSLKGDVVVLLGGGIRDGAPDLTGEGTPGEEMMTRIVTALRTQRRLNVPVIVSGGTVVPGRAPEAQIVRRFLLDLGVPPEKVLVEDKSRDTVENARLSRALCARHGFKNPLLVTSAFHMRRARLAFVREGLAVTPLPANFRTWDKKKYVWLDYLPDAGALGDSATAIRERLGLLVATFYAAKGKRLP